mmetsp:Transcript_57870/g.132937  ORF Transcript_57870/g.132937 Transcript_57870/m.132937 type:complete len:123 (-) Transcript_57870:905-1273(-)
MRTRIPHVRQSFNWDCGFACVEMSLRALGVEPQRCSLQQLRTRAPHSSIWRVQCTSCRSSRTQIALAASLASDAGPGLLTGPLPLSGQDSGSCTRFAGFRRSISVPYSDARREPFISRGGLL